MTITAESVLRGAAITAIEQSIPLAALIGSTYNYLSSAETFSSPAYWSSLGVPLAATPNQTDYAGGATATLLEDAETGEAQYLQQTPAQIPPSGRVSWAVDMKAGTSSYATLEINHGASTWAANVDLALGTVTNQTAFPPIARGITSLGGGWYRVFIEGSVNGVTSPTARIYAANGNAGAGAPSAAAVGSIYAARAGLFAQSSYSTYYRRSLWTDPSRVFSDASGYIGARNRGRLPFIELEVDSQQFNQETKEGGTLNSRVIMRAHVTGSLKADAADQSQKILGYALAAIRSVTANNYFAAGSDDIGPVERGPWGFQRTATMIVEHSWDRTTYEVV